MNPQPENIKAVRDAYSHGTGISISDGMHEGKFYAYCKAGFTSADMADVLGWIKRENKKHNYQYSVKLSTLIGDLEHFDELRGLAHRRKPPVRSEGQKTLDSFRGYEQEPPTSKTISIGDILRRASNGG